MNIQSQSLAGRAALALLLTLGFYGLALAVAGALLFVVYAQVAFFDRISLRLTAGCLLGAGLILWSVLPRRDRFVAPGPLLRAADHPRLFKHIEEVAGKVAQPMPAEVYLLPEVNAFVVERGGLMGLGAKRVMGIGLPLLQVLTVAQFRAVLTHEFGHYHGGDTKLGPWIYRTRSAIIRTVQSLGQSVLQMPFRWYGEMFLRITQGISRQQEFVADRLAAQAEGARQVVESLRRVHSAGLAYTAFWQNEVAPVLSAGYQPPLADGFNQFVAIEAIQSAMQKSEASALETSVTDPYDTHPSLKERVAAVQSVAGYAGAPDESPALALLDSLPALERALLAHVVGTERAHQWKSIQWGEVGEAVYVPAWRKSLGPFAAAWNDVKLGDLPEFLRNPETLAASLRAGAKRPLTQDEIQAGVQGLAGIALALALLQNGWALTVNLGAEVSLRHAGHEVRPFSLARELVSGDLPADDWRRRCESMGITGVALGGAGA